jgi:hypothetical protein
MLEKCAKFPRVTLAQLKPSLSSRIADDLFRAQRGHARECALASLSRAMAMCRRTSGLDKIRVTLAQLKPSLSSRIADVAGLFPHAQQILQDAR